MSHSEADKVQSMFGKKFSRLFTLSPDLKISINRAPAISAPPILCRQSSPTAVTVLCQWRKSWRNTLSNRCLHRHSRQTQLPSTWERTGHHSQDLGKAQLCGKVTGKAEAANRAPKYISTPQGPGSSDLRSKFAPGRPELVFIPVRVRMVSCFSVTHGRTVHILCGWVCPNVVPHHC